LSKFSVIYGSDVAFLHLLQNALADKEFAFLVVYRTQNVLLHSWCDQSYVTRFNLGRCSIFGTSETSQFKAIAQWSWSRDSRFYFVNKH